MAKRVWQVDLEGIEVAVDGMTGKLALKKNGVDVTTFVVKFDQAMLFALARHGLKQKTQDSFAGLEKKGGTEADHVDEVKKVVDNLNAGKFKTVKVKEATMTLKGMIKNALLDEDEEMRPLMLKGAFKMFGAQYDEKLVVKCKEELEEEEAEENA